MHPIEVTTIAFLKQDVFILGEAKDGYQISDSVHCRTTLNRKVTRFYLECNEQIYALQKTEGIIKGFKKIVVKNIVKEFAQLLSEEIKAIFDDKTVYDIIWNRLKSRWIWELEDLVKIQEGRSGTANFFKKLSELLEELPDMDRVKLIRTLHGDTILILLCILTQFKVSKIMMKQIWKSCKPEFLGDSADIETNFFNKKWNKLETSLAEKYTKFIQDASASQDPSSGNVLELFNATADSFFPKILKEAISREYSDLFDLFLKSHYVETSEEQENFEIIKDDLPRHLNRLSHFLNIENDNSEQYIEVLSLTINLLFQNFAQFTCQTKIDNTKVSQGAARCIRNIQQELRAYRSRYEIKPETPDKMHLVIKSMLGNFALTDEKWAVSLFAVDSSTEGNLCGIQGGHAMICIEGVQHGSYFRHYSHLKRDFSGNAVVILNKDFSYHIDRTLYEDKTTKKKDSQCVKTWLTSSEKVEKMIRSVEEDQDKIMGFAIAGVSLNPWDIAAEDMRSYSILGLVFDMIFGAMGFRITAYEDRECSELEKYNCIRWAIKKCEIAGINLPPRSPITFTPFTYVASLPNNG